MGRILSPGGEPRLEGLCGGTADAARGAGSRITVGPGSAGIERLEARFVGQSFAPHRHDTYAIGITLSGVQGFFYRGERRHCLPGQCHILHPDELHDGSPATPAGFAYRIAYVDPALVQSALGGRPLPFVADPVVAAGVVRHALPPALWGLEDPIDGLEQAEFIAAVADTLLRLGGLTGGKRTPLRLPSLMRVRDLIAADPATPHPADALERASGLDRWTLARQFRAAFGTSPSAFRTMRQLDRVRRMIRDGMPLAEAAVEAGFSDQSHMSRLFKRTYGLTPARWAAALSRGA